jgi:hypothetical protein
VNLAPPVLLVLLGLLALQPLEVILVLVAPLVLAVLLVTQVPLAFLVQLDQLVYEAKRVHRVGKVSRALPASVLILRDLLPQSLIFLPLAERVKHMY